MHLGRCEPEKVKAQQSPQYVGVPVQAWLPGNGCRVKSQQPDWMKTWCDSALCYTAISQWKKQRSGKIQSLGLDMESLYSALSQIGGLSKEGEVSEAEVTGTGTSAGAWKQSFFKSITGIL